MEAFARFRRTTVCVLVTVIGLGLVVAAAWVLHVKQSSVDLATGKERDRFLVFGMCVVEQVRETPFSEILQNGKNIVPDWRVFSETGPLRRISPHFTHHSTPTILKETMLVGDLLNAPADVRWQMCLRVLEHLKNNDRTGAKEILDEWWKEGKTD